MAARSKSEPSGSESALEAAARVGDAARVSELIRRGAKPTGADLATAITAGDVGCVSALIDAGADPLAADEFGVTPIFLVAGGGHPAVAAFLGDPDHTDPSSPLWPDHTASVGHGEILWLLLDLGADPNARCPTRGNPTAPGTTPLMTAAAFGYTPAIDVLLARGADVDAHDAAGRTARNWAEKSAHRAAVERFKSLGRR